MLIGCFVCCWVVLCCVVVVGCCVMWRLHSRTSTWLLNCPAAHTTLLLRRTMCNSCSCCSTHLWAVAPPTALATRLRTCHWPGPPFWHSPPAAAVRMAGPCGCCCDSCCVAVSAAAAVPPAAVVPAMAVAAVCPPAACRRCVRHPSACSHRQRRSHCRCSVCWHLRHLVPPYSQAPAAAAVVAAAPTEVCCCYWQQLRLLQKQQDEFTGKLGNKLAPAAFYSLLLGPLLFFCLLRLRELPSYDELLSAVEKRIMDKLS